jgi:peptidoglycan L-alanyl-D-glutamate endopeptidase CwlK
MFGNDVLFLQRFLKSAHFYDGTLDGIYGPKTNGALTAFEDESEQIAAQHGRFDRRTEQNIMTLQLPAQEKARQLMSGLQKSGMGAISARVISGTRTYAEQAEIYALGRIKPGRIVTKAAPGHSNHNFGIAWDIGLFQDGDYLEESPGYKAAGQIGKGLGLEWGGDWSSFIDLPHYQLPTRFDMAGLRQNFESGTAFV